MKVQLFVLILFFSTASVIALIAYYVFGHRNQQLTKNQ